MNSHALRYLIDVSQGDHDREQADHPRRCRPRDFRVEPAGTGYAFNESYLVLGLGVSYYLIDGLNVGLSVESWTGSDPKLYKVTPSVQYVFYQIPKLNPYIGAFYRRTYVESLPDIDSAGARAGVYFPVGRNAYFGAGAVYESYIDCKKTVYTSCSDTYPELSVVISF